MLRKIFKFAKSIKFKKINYTKINLNKQTVFFPKPDQPYFTENNLKIKVQNNSQYITISDFKFDMSFMKLSITQRQKI